MKHKIIPSFLLLKLLYNIRLVNITLPRRLDLTESLSDVQCSAVTVDVTAHRRTRTRVIKSPVKLDLWE